MLATALAPAGLSAPAGERVSAVGRYSGWSPILYDGYRLSSQYVTARDGTRLAIDIIRPTSGGKLVETRLPVLWMNTPYNRRKDRDGVVAQSYPGAALALVKYGYVVAVADMRGNYASFGTAVHSNRAEWMPDAFWDAYDITEWLAAQSWSDSNVGMWGCSATGHSQWQAAATKAPHLKAIFPMSAPSEYYDWNGVTSTEAPPPQSLPGAVPKRDAEATPVDADRDGALLKTAAEQHRNNLEPGFMPYRDSASPELARLRGLKDFRYWEQANTFTHFPQINASRIPAYETANFGEDQRVKLGVLVKLHNVTSPMKLIFAPGNHCNWSSPYKTNPLNPFDVTVEELRWFDYWLKGKKNGILDEPPIYLFTYNRPKDAGWQYAWQWPLPTTHDINYYFAPGAAADEPRRGGLSMAAPNVADAHDRYVTDYAADIDNRDARGMTYTTPAFAADTTLIGHPVLHAWVTSTAQDGDLFAHLEDVAPDGAVTPLPGTDDGQVRASMRKLNRAPYDNLGLPYHRSYAADAAPLVPGQPAELVFDLAPISWVAKAGHRIRLVLTASAKDHHGGPPATPVLDPPPVLGFLRERGHASFLTLPVNRPIEAALRVTGQGAGRTARLTFPASLDGRYLRDIKPGSVTVNGRPAAVRLEGRTLVAAVPAGAGAALTVTGTFGGRYDYGEMTRFVAAAAPPR